jgi:hypothetical protein
MTNMTCNASLLCHYEYFMLKQCLENIGEGLLHAFISSYNYIFYPTIQAFLLRVSHERKFENGGRAILFRVWISDKIQVHNCDMFVCNQSSNVFYARKKRGH